MVYQYHLSDDSKIILEYLNDNFQSAFLIKQFHEEIVFFSKGVNKDSFLRCKKWIEKNPELII